jgi:hypothetical protein
MFLNDLPPIPQKKKPGVKRAYKKQTRGKWLNTEDAANYFANITHRKKPCVSTVRNWMRTGRVGYDGERVKLGHELRSGKMMTTKKQLVAFAEAMLDEDLRIK